VNIGGKDTGEIRDFGTGATRDTADGKLDPSGYISPIVMLQFYSYMKMNELSSNGEIRSSDNWQGGMPKPVYAKSLRRHYEDVALWMDGYDSYVKDGIIAALCGVMFNCMGLLFEVLRDRKFRIRDFMKEPTPEIVERMKKFGVER